MKYGYVFPKGITHVETLVALVEDLQSSLPDRVRVILEKIPLMLHRSRRDGGMRRIPAL